jgi:hypothetical protein
MLGKYKKKCEKWTRFQVGYQFESFKVSHWVMPFMKPGHKVLYNVKTKHMKPWSNVYLNYIETLTWY